jgi:hypothetical protein
MSARIYRVMYNRLFWACIRKFPTSSQFSSSLFTWKARWITSNRLRVCILAPCLFIIINIKDWTLWSVPSPELQLLSPNVSSVFQLFSFLAVCSDMISKGFDLVAFFASVKASSVCIYLSCLVCIQSVVHGVRSRLFCGHKWCSLPEVSITSFLSLQFFVSVRLSQSNFLTYIKM